MTCSIDDGMTGPSPYDDLEGLDEDRCFELLGTAQIGRLAWCDEGRILVLPVNFVLDGQDVIIRSAAGAKLAAARYGRHFAFEVDDVEPALHTGWSVVLAGRGELVTEQADSQRLAEMVQPWSRAERPNVVRITAEQVTGRRVPLHAGGVTVLTSSPRLSRRRVPETYLFYSAASAMRMRMRMRMPSWLRNTTHQSDRHQPRTVSGGLGDAAEVGRI